MADNRLTLFDYTSQEAKPQGKKQEPEKKSATRLSGGTLFDYTRGAPEEKARPAAPMLSGAAQREAAFKKAREEEKGFFGRLTDLVFGGTETPKAYTPQEIGQRQKDIASEQQKLLARAARYEQLAKAAGPGLPGTPEETSNKGLLQAASDARRQAAALGAESKRIVETGMPVPKVQYTREAAGAAPRQFIAGTLGLPGEGLELVGRGLGALEEATGAKLGAKQTKALAKSWNDAVQRGSEAVFGAPGEALQYSRPGQIVTDVAGGAGSIATFAVPTSALKLAGVGKGLVGAERTARIAQVARPFEYGIAGGQGLQQGRQDIEAFEKRTGKPVSDASAFSALLVNAGLGLTEVGVLNRVLGRIPAPQRAAAMGRLGNIVERATAGKIKPTGVRTEVRSFINDVERLTPGGKVLVAGGAEGAQEAGVQFGTNLAAKVLYDPDRDLAENVAYSGLIGGVVGAGVRGSIDLRRHIGNRAANNRRAAFEQLGGEGDVISAFDINVGSPEDPSQLVRQRVQIISPPDQNGNVIALRPDGTRYQASLVELEKMRAPTEGIRAVAIPETLSRPAITERLTAALGNTAPDEDAASYIKNLTTTLNNNMAMGIPEDTDASLQKQQNALKKSRLPEEVRIARMLVLDEAAKVHNDYLNLVTAPPEGAGIAPTQPIAPPPSLAETLAVKAADAAEAREERAHLMNGIIGSTDIIDKTGAFADALASAGMNEPSAVETAVLRDAMRLESEAETAAGQEKDTRDRQRIVERMDIIEPVLFDDRIAPEKKAERINIKLRNKGYKPLNRPELERMAGYEAANAVFGPEGEYTQRRQAVLDQVLADPTITDKYRGYAEALDQFPELGEPTPEEIRALRGDAAELEAQIAPGEQALPTEILPAEPGAAPAEFIEQPTPVVEEVAPPVAEEVAPEAAPVVEEVAPVAEEGNVTAMRDAREERRKRKIESNLQLINERLDGLSSAMDAEPAAIPQMSVNTNKALQSLYDRFDNLYIEAPTDLEPMFAQIEEKFAQVKNKLDAGLPQVANENVAAPEVAPEQPAGGPVTLTPYENTAMSVQYYKGGMRAMAVGAQKPSWLPDPTSLYEGISVDGRTLGDKPDVRILDITGKDGEPLTAVTVSVRSTDEIFGDRGNTAAATVWTRNADPADIESAIQTAEAMARWVADSNNSKTADGPLNQIADRAIKFVADQGGVAVAKPAEAKAPAPKAKVAPEQPAPVAEEVAPAQPAPTAATQVINNPDADISPVEEKLEADPNTIEGAFPASTSRPRAEAIGFAADLDQRVKRMSSRFTRAINYKYQTASDYAQALAASYGLTQLPPNLNVARRFELLESRKIGGQMRLSRWHLQPIEDKIKQLGLNPKDVDVFLWARSAPGRNALIREKGGPENGSGMSDAEARAKLSQFELEGLGPALREVAKLHDNLVDYIGAQRVKAGLMSKADWRAMRKAQPYYTPLKGYALEGDMQVDGEPNPHSDEERGIASRNGTRIREVLTTEGRESMPFSPLANLMSDAQFAIARIEQNKVKTAFLDNVLSDPKAHEGLVTVYTLKKEKHSGGLTTLPKMGKNGPVDMIRLASMQNPELMIVKKDGKPYFIEFAKTPAGNALYRAFANMTPPQLNGFFNGTTLEVGGKRIPIPGVTAISNGIKSLKTRYNPIYLGSTAWMRDFNEAILTAYAAQGHKGGAAEGTKIGRKTAKYIASLSGADAISDYLRGKDPTTAEGEVMTLLFDQFLEDGGSVGHAQIADAETMAQDTAKRIKRYAAMQQKNPVAAALMAKDIVLKGLDDFSQFIDLQARFATYRAALEEGLSRDDAAALALDSSLNLTRRGEWAPFLDTWAFFFSPSVEGGRKLLSQGRYSTIARKLFTKTVMMGAALYLLNRFVFGGDDDEDGRPNILEVNNATAQSRVILRYGPGVNDYVSIPVSFGMGYFNYVGGQLMAAVLGDISPEEAAVNLTSGLISMTTPIKTEGSEGLSSIVNFIVPDPAQPLWDLVVNRNAFGSQIYTAQEYRTTPKSELGRENTAEAWKMIARGMNSMFGGTATIEKWSSMQPEQYRYIIEQYLGGAYGIGRDTVNLVADEPKPDQTILQRIPIIKGFFGKGGEYAPMNKFYDNYDRLNAIYAVYDDSEARPDDWAENEEAFPAETDERVMQAFGDAKSMIRTIRSDYRDGVYADKQAMYDDLNEVYKNFNKTYNEVKEEYKNK